MTHAGRLWWAAAAVAAVGMVVALPVVLREPAATAVPEEGEETTRASADSVRVEHELVTLDAEVPSAGQPVVTPAAPVARSLPQPKPKPSMTFSTRESTITAPTSTFTKARQKFLGDGRHRPEPFPRVR